MSSTPYSQLPLPGRSVGVLGAGLMGRQIALANLRRGFSVLLWDVCRSTLAEATAEIHERIEAGPGHQSTEAHAEADAPGSPELVADKRCRLTAVASIQEMAGCPLVVESVVEDAGVKRHVLADAEAVLENRALLATNTSSLMISQLASFLNRPERFLGMHFCHPLDERRLVEIVPGEKTSPATTSAALNYAALLARFPLLVRDRPGFLLNRLLVPYLNTALELLGEGVGPDAVETAARTLGMPVGPFTFMDSIGIDTALRVGGIICRAFPDRLRPSGLLVALYKAGHLGRKSGAGFFLYESERGEYRGRSIRPVRRRLNPRLESLIGRGTNRARSWPPERIVRPLQDSLRLEAALALKEGVVDTTADVRSALAEGVGFRGTLGPPLADVDRHVPRSA